MQITKKLSSLLVVIGLGLSNIAFATQDVWDSATPWTSTPAYFAGWDVFNFIGQSNADTSPDVAGSGGGTFAFVVPGMQLLSNGNVVSPTNTTSPAYIAKLAVSPASFYDVYVRMESIRTTPDTMTATINYTSDEGVVTQYTGVQTVSYSATANEFEYSWKFSNVPGSYAYIVNIAQSSPSLYTITNLAEIAAIPIAAVPEPDTYAVMLAGLGLLGFVALRRRK